MHILSQRRLEAPHRVQSCVLIGRGSRLASVHQSPSMHRVWQRSCHQEWFARQRRRESRTKRHKSQSTHRPCGITCLAPSYVPHAFSSLSNAAPIFSIGFTLSSCSISSNSGGVCGAERNSSIASFQLIEPEPGQWCESRSLALSCTWVERTCGFTISNASATL